MTWSKAPSIKKIVITAASIALLSPWIAPHVTTVSAADLSQVMVRLDRVSDSTATGGRVCATPSVANQASTENNVQVTFPAGFSVNTSPTNWQVNTNNLDVGQTAWPGIAQATVINGQTVTFPSGDLTSSSTFYCFNFASASTLTTPPSTGNNLIGTVTTRTSAPATIDSSGYALSIIADDQITINASVGATLTLALDGNTDTFGGTLDPSLVNSTSGRTVTITTNAAGGYFVWAQGQNDSASSAGKGALESASAGHTIPLTNALTIGSASHTLTPGTEDYGLGVALTNDAAGGGTAAVDAAYNTTAQTRIGVLSTTMFRPIASSNGTANGDVFTLIGRATISNSTPAASDYTDTITVIAAGTF